MSGRQGTKGTLRACLVGAALALGCAAQAQAGEEASFHGPYTHKTFERALKDVAVLEFWSNTCRYYRHGTRI